MAFVAEDLVRFAQGVTFAIVVSVFVVDAVGLVTTLHRLECNLEARASRRASSSGPPTTSSPSKWCGWGGNGGTTLYDIHQSIPHERISFLGERSASSPQRYSTRSSVQQVAVGTRSTGTAGASFGRRGEPAGGHSKPDIKGQSRPLLSPQEKCAEEASMLLTLPFELDATTTLAMYEAGRTKTRVAATGGGRGSLAESGESGSRAETRALSHLRWFVLCEWGCCAQKNAARNSGGVKKDRTPSSGGIGAGSATIPLVSSSVEMRFGRNQGKLNFCGGCPPRVPPVLIHAGVGARVTLGSSIGVPERCVSERREGVGLWDGDSRNFAACVFPHGASVSELSFPQVPRVPLSLGFRDGVWMKPTKSTVVSASDMWSSSPCGGEFSCDRARCFVGDERALCQLRRPHARTFYRPGALTLSVHGGELVDATPAGAWFQQQTRLGPMKNSLEEVSFPVRQSVGLGKGFLPRRGRLLDMRGRGSASNTRETTASGNSASDSRCNISSNANGEHVHTMVEVTEDFSDGDDFEETLQDLLKHLGGPVCLLLYLFFGAMDSDGVLLSVTSLAA